jgi:hypothetical protein
MVQGKKKKMGHDKKMFNEEKTIKAGEKVKIQILRKHQQLTGTLQLTEMVAS